MHSFQAAVRRPPVSFPVRLSLRTTTVLVVAAAIVASAQVSGGEQPPPGFKPLFDGRDLSGWHGETPMDPAERAALTPEQIEKRGEADRENARAHWRVDAEGDLVTDGGGCSLASDAAFGDVELLVDWKTAARAEGAVCLRGAAVARIGGPTAAAGEWNRLRIRQVGERTWVHLNDKPVIDGATARDTRGDTRPPPATGPIRLEARGGEARWRNAFVREIPAAEATERLRGLDDEGFESVFNGRDFTGWAGAVDNYQVEDGAIVCKPKNGGTVHTAAEYGDFVARLEFQLPPAGNNGLAIRYPGNGDPAYTGMCELQVLDTEHPRYATIDPRQAHGSAYGMVAAHRGYLRPTGEWNYQQVTVKGSTVKVELNGVTILDADIGPVKEFMANSPHPGKGLAKGFFGFSGHGDPVKFRNIAIRRIDPSR